MEITILDVAFFTCYYTDVTSKELEELKKKIISKTYTFLSEYIDYSHLDEQIDFVAFDMVQKDTIFPVEYIIYSIGEEEDTHTVYSEEYEDLRGYYYY